MPRSTSLYIDDHELGDLYVDLRGAPGRAQRGITKVVRRGAELIDEQMTIDARGHVGSWFSPRRRHKKATPLERHVSHEMVSLFMAHIGIEAKGAGLLGSIIANGSVNNEPAYDADAGPRRALPLIVELLADMGEDAVFGDSGVRAGRRR